MALQIRNLATIAISSTGTTDLYTAGTGKSAVIASVLVNFPPGTLTAALNVTVSGTTAVVYPATVIGGATRIQMTDRITLGAGNKISIDVTPGGSPGGNLVCLVSGLERDV
jgi:hypothetical protein